MVNAFVPSWLDVRSLSLRQVCVSCFVGWNVEVAEGCGGCRDWCACLSPSAAGDGNYSWERCPQHDASCQWDCPGRQRQTAARAESQHSSLGLGQQRHQHLPVSRWATAVPHCMKERERERENGREKEGANTSSLILLQFEQVTWCSLDKYTLAFKIISFPSLVWYHMFIKSPETLFDFKKNSHRIMLQLFPLVSA